MTRYVEDTCPVLGTASTLQIVSAYSRTARSEENRPMRATFSTDIRVRRSTSSHVVTTASCLAAYDEGGEESGVSRGEETGSDPVEGALQLEVRTIECSRIVPASVACMLHQYPG